jgi:Eukaryotic DNA topoisomerase I, catalytic core
VAGESSAPRSGPPYPGHADLNAAPPEIRWNAAPTVRSLKRRPGGGDRLLAYRSGRCWHDVTAADINDYLREVSGGEFTAKDFRTWHATVLAAVGLAVSEGAVTAAARRRAIARVCQEVASYLGNTPAVARASYIDPRVIGLYEEGRTIAGSLGGLGKENAFGDLATAGHTERAVLKLRRSGNSTRSFWPCPVPTTPCSHSSTLPMKSCAPPGTSIGRSVKPRSMTTPGPAHGAQRKKIRLSALRDTGPDQPVIARRRLVAPDPDMPARAAVRP